MRFISFDIETTGFLPGIDNIVEIAAVKFVDGAPHSKFATLIDPQRPMPEAASRVNNITDEMLKGQPTIDKILEPFAEFCGNDILVAHNAAFDVQFLASDILKHETPSPTGYILDTLAMSRKIMPGLPNYKLGTLVQHFKIPTTDFHRAEEDASYCGLLFSRLLEKVFREGEAPAIENLIALSNNQSLKFPVVERKPKQLGLF